METSVFMIRHGVTEWHSARRILGHNDIDLSEEGRRQAELCSETLAGERFSEILSSPLQRALQTAEIISSGRNIAVARDPRLIDLDVGRWAGLSYDDTLADPAYHAFLEDPTAAAIPGGEELAHAQRRAVASIEQALEDTPAGESVAMVSHSAIIRIVLVHYLGSPLANYHRLRVSPGSVTVLRFAGHGQPPQVVGVNLADSAQLKAAQSA